jgi:hypothetical protein
VPGPAARTKTHRFLFSGWDPPRSLSVSRGSRPPNEKKAAGDISVPHRGVREASPGFAVCHPMDLSLWAVD